MSHALSDYPSHSSRSFDEFFSLQVEQVAVKYDYFLSPHEFVLL